MTEPGIFYYDIDGNKVDYPLGSPEYVGLWDIENRRVAETSVGRYWVSTVHLPIDHSFGHGKPVIFETMIFQDGDEVDTYRYCTKEEAIEGHAAAVALARSWDQPKIEEDPV